MPDHFFWWLLSMACVVWYSTITIYVTIKGIADIRGMIRRLSSRNSNKTAPPPSPSPSGRGPGLRP